MSYSNLTELDGDVEATAVIGRGMRSKTELDKRVRMDRSLEALREDQRELLRSRFAERMTLEDIAAETGRSKQSVHEKVQQAVQDLYVAMARTWNLPYDAADELFGYSKPSGRPTRDKEGEQRAAEFAVLGYLSHQREDTDE